MLRRLLVEEVDGILALTAGGLETARAAYPELGPVLSAARERLHHDFAIDHATLQIEPADARGACQPVSW